MTTSKNDDLRALVKEIRAARPELDLPADPTRAQLLALLAAQPAPAPRLVALNVRIPADLRNKLKVKAAGSSSTVQEIVAQALHAYLDS